MRYCREFSSGEVLPCRPVRFDTPGVYPYLCLVHVSGMMGTVEVVGSDEPVPDQAAIDAQAGAELVGQVRRLAQTRGQADQARSQPGPAGTTTWHVNAGAGFGAIHPFEFLPRDLTVRSGDTVVWSSTYFHSITFNPTPPPPLWIVPEPQDEGPPLMLLNRLITQPSEPSGVFDPTQYFNSADLGPFSRLGASWSLTFDRPGQLRVLLCDPPRPGYGRKHHRRPSVGQQGAGAIGVAET